MTDDILKQELLDMAADRPCFSGLINHIRLLDVLTRGNNTEHLCELREFLKNNPAILKNIIHNNLCDTSTVLDESHTEIYQMVWTYVYLFRYLNNSSLPGYKIDAQKLVARIWKRNQIIKKRLSSIFSNKLNIYMQQQILYYCTFNMSSDA